MKTNQRNTASGSKSLANIFNLSGNEKGLLLITLLLFCLGLVFVFEASGAEAFQTFGNQFYFIRQQAMWSVVGLVALIAGI